MSEKKLFWAPNVRWCIGEENELVIENFVFNAEYSCLFPDFYFVCSKGINETMILEFFSQFNKIKLKKFVARLRSAHILIDHIQSIEELFSGQDRMFQTENELEHDYFMLAENVKEFRRKCLNRKVIDISTRSYDIFSERVLSERLSSRKSVRDFNENEIISYSDFSYILESISQFDNGGEFGQYCYPSAGGLYPIDCYIYMKPNRVEKIEDGLYYYDPIRRKLHLISDGSSINRECHYFINKDIFTSSAFSMFFVYNAKVSMPKYGKLAYYYGILDAGIMVGYLNLVINELRLGCCCIGDMKFSMIEKEFDLDEYQTYLHCIEVGIPK